MPRDRDWVDYANLASNVVQNVQLSSINDKMRQMAELELHKEYRVQQEAVVAQRENMLRDAVFYYAEQLRDVEEILSQNPVDAYVRASFLKVTYDRMPQFSASGFRNYEDKERLANVKRAYDRFIRECASRLKPDELEKADRCISHIAERDDLLRLIEAQKKKEGLGIDRQSLHARRAAKEAELCEVHAQQARNACPLWLGACVFVGVVCLVLAAIVFFFGVIVTALAAPPVETSALLTAIVLGIAGLFLVLMFSRSRYSQLKTELAERHRTIEHEIGLLWEDARQVEAVANECKPLYEQFGEADVQGYRKLLAERDELLVQVVGDAAKSLVQRQQPREKIETAPTRDVTGVYVFGPHLPPHGYCTPSVETAIEEFRRFGLISPQTHDYAEMLNELVGMGYTFFHKKASGNIEVVGKIPPQTTVEGQQRAAKYLGLEKHERVQYRSTPTATPTQTTVELVL